MINPNGKEYIYIYIYEKKDVYLNILFHLKLLIQCQYFPIDCRLP